MTEWHLPQRYTDLARLLSECGCLFGIGSLEI
jgi:hypothetical protein